MRKFEFTMICPHCSFEDLFLQRQRAIEMNHNGKTKCIKCEKIFFWSKELIVGYNTRTGDLNE